MNGKVNGSILDKIVSRRKKVISKRNVLCVMWLERNKWEIKKHRYSYHLDISNIDNIEWLNLIWGRP